MELVTSGLLASGARAREAVPPSVPESVDGAARCGSAFLLWIDSVSSRPTRFPASSQCCSEKALGSLRQSAICRAGSVLAYLSRYTHWVAISNSRLIAFDQSHVTFRYKDYRRNGADRHKVMTLVRIHHGASRRRSRHRRHRPKLEIPIAIALYPAGSLLGGFRASANARNSSRS